MYLLANQVARYEDLISRLEIVRQKINNKIGYDRPYSLEEMVNAMDDWLVIETLAERMDMNRQIKEKAA